MSNVMIHLTVDTLGQSRLEASPDLSPSMVGLYLVELAARWSKLYPSTSEERMAYQLAQQVTDDLRGHHD